MSASYNDANLVDTTTIVRKIRYYDNTKGSILITDGGSNVKVVAPGTDGQVLVSDPIVGAKWYSLPPVPSISVLALTGAVNLYANTLSYGRFNNHTIVSEFGSIGVEVQYVRDNCNLIAFDIVPSGNNTWPAGSNFVFEVGYLKGLGGVGEPNLISTVTGSTNTFVPITGATITVGAAYSLTRTSATLIPSSPIAITGPSYITFKCDNTLTANSGLWLTVVAWLRTSI